MSKLTLLFLGLVSVALVTSGCGARPSPIPSPEVSTLTIAPPASPEEGERAMPFELTSSAFVPGGPIPRQYTCDGEDISPPLEWSDPPAGTQSFALICDDPDAPVGIWVHWVLYNLPAETRSLSPAVPSDADLPGGGQQGKNSWRRLGYGGPCPPRGTHRYFFKLYALDTMLDLVAGANKERLLRAIEGHVLVQTELMGTYTRR